MNQPNAWDALLTASRADEDAYEYDNNLLAAQRAVEAAIRAPLEAALKAAQAVVDDFDARNESFGFTEYKTMPIPMNALRAALAGVPKEANDATH